jgi:GR25 family glycosyltransferase involved in LPS biosynthesis
MKCFTDIQNILYINLDDNIDRKEHMVKELSKMNWIGKRFAAIKHENGAYGCTQSHIHCLQIALENQWDHVLICEDDLTFLNADLLIQQLDGFLQKKREKDWDVVLLAGNNYPPSQLIDEYSIKITNCQSACCYLVNKHYIETLLNNFLNGYELLMTENKYHIYAIDQFWKRLQNQDNWFLIIPLNATQQPGYSDIEKKYVDYTDLMTNLKI